VLGGAKHLQPQLTEAGVLLKRLLATGLAESAEFDAPGEFVLQERTLSPTPAHHED